MRKVIVSVMVAMAGMAGAAQAAPIETPDIPEQFDPDNTLSCTQLVPKVLSLTPMPTTTLSVRVLLDGGVTAGQAATAADAMRRAYTPVGIPLDFTYQTVSFAGTAADGINAQAKALFGGQRPAGVDVVYTMTGKDLTLDGSPAGDNVAGLADCIGGVRYADRAFATGELVTGLQDGAGKTMGHEVGHLLGGHHHYSSPEGLLGGGLLDLMGPVIDLVGLRFSTLNSLVVRGHTQLYAAP